MSSPQHTLRFDITGMMCAACSSRLERVLAMQPGVARASVNLATATATVIPGDGVDTDQLTSLIAEVTRNAGFGASLQGPDQDENAAFQARQQAMRADVAARRSRLLPEALLTVAIMAISMGHMTGVPLPAAIDPHINPLRSGLVQLALALPVMFLGRAFYLSGIPKLVHRTPNMDTLVSLGTGTALLYSLWSLAEIAWGTPEQATHGAENLYFESCAMLITMISFGKFLESASCLTLTNTMGGLLSLCPRTALAVLEENGGRSVKEVPVETILPGDVLEVRPGMNIPVDGAVISGRSSIDASMLTGESMPVPVTLGDALTGGTRNIDGLLVMRAEKVGADTALAGMARMIREAQNTKAPIARLADKASMYFVPCVMILATTAGLGWLLSGSTPAEALRTFVAVMVVACPCALGLATPLSIMTGTSQGARLGVLIRHGAALEAAGRVTTVVFDKTGTLTTGRPKVTRVMPLPGFEPDTVLAIAAALEAGSAHPLAHAISEEARNRNIPLPVAENESTIPGLGLTGNVDGRKAMVGSLMFMRENKISTDGLEMAAKAFLEQGETVVAVMTDGQPAGLIGIADSLRPEAVETVDALLAMGVNVHLLSGDTARTAKAVGRLAHINNVMAEVKPDGKAAAVEALQARGEIVAMVGDGINDGPALARADIGLAMSDGIDIAVDAGDAILVGGRGGRGLLGVVTALRLGRATLRNIRQNLAWAFGYNLVLIPIAAGLLRLFGGPGMSPMLAGAAMACSSVTVVLNAMRLCRFKG